MSRVTATSHLPPAFANHKVIVIVGSKNAIAHFIFKDVTWQVTDTIHVLPIIAEDIRSENSWDFTSCDADTFGQSSWPSLRLTGELELLHYQYQ